ncbi:MAG: Fe-S cluster assembly protein SufD [Bacteroidales bacterium]
MNDSVSVAMKSDLIGLFEKSNGELESGSGHVINFHREKALSDFERLGIPTTKNENYRYTPLEQYFNGQYEVELSPNPLKIDIRSIFKCDVPELDTHVVLVLNGFFAAGLQVNGLPDGVVACSLSEASVKYPGLFEAHYSKYADTSVDGLVALNTLFAQDGVFVYIPKNVTVKKPIQIINLSHSFKNLRITRRNLIVAEENSTCDIVVCDHSLCNHSYLTNSLTEIHTGKNASLNFDRLQNENSRSTQINNLFIHQLENSRFSSNSISLHGGLIRNSFYVTLDGTGAEANLNGLFLCDDRQHVANFVLMDHASPLCTSNQLFKGILDEEATGAFNGKILVRKDAQKTQAYQKNNNILLSSTARMNTKPHLEIYADDVKCSHGATVGQLDKDALFYLRSRGIPETEARHLLMYAFANEIVSRISIPVLKERIIDLVDKRLKGELSKCNDCNIHCG